MKVCQDKTKVTCWSTRDLGLPARMHELTVASQSSCSTVTELVLIVTMMSTSVDKPSMFWRVKVQEENLFSDLSLEESLEDIATILSCSNCRDGLPLTVIFVPSVNCMM